MPTKRTVDYSDYANQIVKAIPRGILLTTKAGEKVNAMTIGWGTLGTNWSRPVFVAYVRRHRSTIVLLDRNPEFTINVPLEERPSDRKIIGICGSERGDEVDKVALAGLTLVDSDIVSVPGIAELPLTLEVQGHLPPGPGALALLAGHHGPLPAGRGRPRDWLQQRPPHHLLRRDRERIRHRGLS